MTSLFSKLYIAKRTITAVPSITIHGVAAPTEIEIEEEKAAKLALAASFGIFGAADEPSDQVRTYRYWHVRGYLWWINY